MYKIRIKVRGIDFMKMEGDYRKMTTRGTEQIAKKLVDLLKMNVADLDLIWTGRLYDNIIVNAETRTKFDITMPAYGTKFEEPRPIRYASRELIAWAYDKLPRPGKFIQKVKTTGYVVQPRPFISNAMLSLEPQIPFIMLENLRRYK
jgi:hypothetical protein